MKLFAGIAAVIFAGALWAGWLYHGSSVLLLKNYSGQRLVVAVRVGDQVIGSAVIPSGEKNIYFFHARESGDFSIDCRNGSYPQEDRTYPALQVGHVDAMGTGIARRHSIVLENCNSVASYNGDWVGDLLERL